MTRQKLDRETRKAILNSRSMIEAVAKADGNEAETRRRIERIFDSLMGYDVLKHVTREHAVHGAGDTEYCDFAVQLDEAGSEAPDMLVEIKRVNIDLMPKHIKQAATYAINCGCEWVLLTNGKEWKLYHISFGQPPQTKLIDTWNLVTGEPSIIAEKFNIVGYKNVRKGGLAKIWEKSSVLTMHNILSTILSENSISLIRRQIKRTTDVAVSPEEVIGAVRRLLNEPALSEMEKLNISVTERRKRKINTPRKNQVQENKGEEVNDGNLNNEQEKPMKEVS